MSGEWGYLAWALLLAVWVGVVVWLHMTTPPPPDDEPPTTNVPW